jgi:Family of unknown function (DUF5995)
MPRAEDRIPVVDPIAGVVARMAEIADGLPAADGVARFNDLYLAVTRAVLAESKAGEFDDAELLARRDERRLTDECLAVADEALGRIDDVAAMWSVARARDAAWTNARTLWAIRHEPRLRDPYLDSLARFVGLASRGLLIRTL